MNRFILLALVLCSLGHQAHAVAMLRWERVPLPLQLIVGQERVIIVDHNVRVGIPSDLTDQLHVQSAGGALYLRADAPIESRRVQLQDAQSGALIFLDVSAVRGVAGQSPLEPVRIVDTTHTPATSAATEDAGEKANGARPSATPTPVPIVLTRFAAQSLYAPLRTVEPVPGIVPVNVQGHLALGSLLPAWPVKARMLAAWRLQGYTVTAIRLTHTESGWLDLDPRFLQGDFYAATFQHRNVGPVGDPSDTTVLYLITVGHSLAESLLPALSGIDAAKNLEAHHEK